MRGGCGREGGWERGEQQQQRQQRRATSDNADELRCIARRRHSLCNLSSPSRFRSPILSSRDVFAASVGLRVRTSVTRARASITPNQKNMQALLLVLLACAGVVAAAREPHRGEQHLVKESGSFAADEEPDPPSWPRSFEVRGKLWFFTRRGRGPSPSFDRDRATRPRRPLPVDGAPHDGGEKVDRKES